MTYKSNAWGRQPQREIRERTQEINKVLRSEERQLGTVVSFPERGKGGLSHYRGNFGAKWVANTFEQVEHVLGRPLRMVIDLCAGSNTTGDVCRAYSIGYRGYDLSQGQDTADPEFDLGVSDVDLAILHPPYMDMILYSGHVWGTAPDPRDLSHMRCQDYYTALLNMQIKAMSVLGSGGFLVLLIGDYVKAGEFIHLTREVPLVGTPYRSVIKIQHNVLSNQTLYSGPYVAIQHEVAHFLRRERSFCIRLSTPTASTLDLRSLNPTSPESLASMQFRRPEPCQHQLNSRPSPPVEDSSDPGSD